MNIEFQKIIKKQIPTPKEERDQVKQVAMKVLAGFLVIMILLTALSRLADTIIIPQISVKSPKNGRVEHKVEATGTLKSNDEKSMSVGEGLIVKSIYVEVGDQVKKGDILFELDTKDIEDKLDVARRDLKKMQLQMKQAALNGQNAGINTAVEDAKEALVRLEEDRLKAIEIEKLKIKRLEDNIKQAEIELEKAKEKLDGSEATDLEKQIEKAKEAVKEAEKNLDNQKYEREKALKRAKQVLDEAKQQYWLVAGDGLDVTQVSLAVDRAQMEYDIAEADWSRNVKSAEEALKIAKSELEKLQNGESDDSELNSGKEKVELLAKQVEEKKQILEDELFNQQTESKNFERKIEDAKAAIAKAEKQEQNEVKEQSQEAEKNAINQELMKLDVVAKEEEIKKLEKIKVQGGQIEAVSEGVVVEIKVEEGAVTTRGELLTFADSENEYVFEAEISEEDSKYIKVGDTVSITLEGESGALEDLVVDNIVPVPGDAESKKKVSVLVKEGRPDMSATMKVKADSEKYNYTLPIEAIKEDGTSFYVLVAKEKETTLGKQIVAERIEVMVQDKNTKVVAVEGAIGVQDSIIIKSNKPIKAGDRVRLIEE